MRVSMWIVVAIVMYILISYIRPYCVWFSQLIFELGQYLAILGSFLLVSLWAQLYSTAQM